MSSEQNPSKQVVETLEQDRLEREAFAALDPEIREQFETSIQELEVDLKSAVEETKDAQCLREQDFAIRINAR